MVNLMKILQKIGDKHSTRICKLLMRQLFICLLNALYFVCCRIDKMKTENESEENRKVIEINMLFLS